MNPEGAMSVALEPGQHLELPISPQATLRLDVRWDASPHADTHAGPHRAMGRPHRPGDAPAGNDLDANVILLDAQDNVVEVVWFRHRQSSHGAVVLSGDDRTGESRGSQEGQGGQDAPGDESVTVSLTELDPEVVRLVLTVNNYGETGLASVRGASCRLVDIASGHELAHADLSSQGAHNALILASLTRGEGGWTLKAIGAPASGKTYWDTMPELLRSL